MYTGHYNILSMYVCMYVCILKLHLLDLLRIYCSTVVQQFFLHQRLSNWTSPDVVHKSTTNLIQWNLSIIEICMVVVRAWPVVRSPRIDDPVQNYSGGVV